MLNYTNLFFPNDYKKNDKIIYNYFKDKDKGRGASLEFRLRKIDETRNYFLDEIKHNDLLCKKKRCKYLNYVENLFTLVSTVTGSVSISASALLVHVPIGIKSAVVGLNIFAIIAGIKKYKWIIKKKKKKAW